MASSMLADIGAGKKNVPLLPLALPGSSAQKPKKEKETKTYVFNLKLGESNDKVYPEFSWANLVKKKQGEELEEKRKQGGTILDPYASDDEDDLKALAARMEAKYGEPPASKGSGGKRSKNVVEMEVDRGAGYDDNDSFIDNTDAYDERVPADYEPKCGGFYINSGRLDVREVRIISDDDSIEIFPIHKKQQQQQRERCELLKKPTLKSLDAKDKLIKPSPIPGGGEKKKVRMKVVGPPGAGPPKLSLQSMQVKPASTSTSDPAKKRPRTISSSSGSSSSSTSSSTSSSSESDKEEEGPVKKSKQDSDIVVLHSIGPTQPKMMKKKLIQKAIGMGEVIRPSISRMTIAAGLGPPPPQRRLKLKNVPPKINTKPPSQQLQSIPSTAAALVGAIISTGTALKGQVLPSGHPVSQKAFVKKTPTISHPTSQGKVFKNIEKQQQGPNNPNVKSKHPITASPFIKVPVPKSTPPQPRSGLLVSTASNRPKSSLPSSKSSMGRGGQMYVDNNNFSNTLVPLSGSGSGGMQSMPSKPTPTRASYPQTSAEAMNKEILKNLAASSATTTSIPAGSPPTNMQKASIKPLPKLKHKSGWTMEQQHSPSPPPVTLKEMKAGSGRLGSGLNINATPLSMHHNNSSGGGLMNMSSSSPSSQGGVNMFQPSSGKMSTMEITKIAKAPSVNFARVEGKEKSITSNLIMTSVSSSSSPSNSMKKMNSYFSNSLLSSPMTSTMSSHPGLPPSVSVSITSGSGLNISPPKLPPSISITPTTLPASDRFTIGSLMSSSSPKYTPFDVKALLSNSSNSSNAKSSTDGPNPNNHRITPNNNNMTSLNSSSSREQQRK